MSHFFNTVSEVVQKLKPVNSVYCLSADNIKSQVRLYKKMFPGSVSWAVKSNPDPMVIQAIYEAGLRDFDVASINEVRLISKLCPNSRLCFNHPVKSAESIHESYYNYAVKIFVADHQDEIRKIFSALKGKTDILLQIRFFDPNITPDSNVNFGKKFGSSPNDSIELLKFAKKLGFNHLGLAFHPSTQYSNAKIYEHLLNIAEDISKAVKHHDIQIEMVNIGGGFPVDYPSEKVTNEKEYLQTVADVIHLAKKKFSSNCEFMCEPGRALVAKGASLLTKVELKRNDGRLYINDGFYGGLMEQYFVGFALPVRVHSHDGRLLSTQKNDFIIFGPTCDSIDVLCKSYHLPSNIEIGDYLEFGFMGAYSNASSTFFNGFEPAEILCVNELEFI